MIELDINNGRKMTLSQDKKDGAITCKTGTENNIDSEFKISAGDMVMLINYYQYKKGRNEEIF